MSATTHMLGWMPKDTALLIVALFGTKYAYYSVGLAPPHAVMPVIQRSVAVLSDDSVSYVVRPFNYDNDSSKYERMDLYVGPFTDTTKSEIYPLRGLVAPGQACHLSPDGAWLLMATEADLAGTRFEGHGTINGTISAIAIIDLRPNSRTQYQFYRVFPDYTNGVRNCSEVWFTAGGAWSGDGQYLYHEWIRREDSTMQIARREVRTGKVEMLSNFAAAP